MSLATGNLVQLPLPHSCRAGYDSSTSHGFSECGCFEKSPLPRILLFSMVLKRCRGMASQRWRVWFTRARALPLYSYVPISQSAHMARNVSLWHQHILPWSHPELPELLYEARHSLCTDPRDKVYGILGLPSSDQTLPVAPPYRLPVHMVYEHIAEHIIL